MCAPLTLRAEGAAEALAMSPDSFFRHVAPELRVVRVGRMRLYPVAELERWVEEHASVALVDELEELRRHADA